MSVSMTLSVSYTVLTGCYLYCQLILYPSAIMSGSGSPSVLYNDSLLYTVWVFMLYKKYILKLTDNMAKHSFGVFCLPATQ